VGQSGAGKTTLASLLLRFYDPTEGRITLDGNDLRDLTLESLRRNISIVTQEPVLFHASISENIAYGSPGATLEQIEESARNAGAHEFIEHLPEGYDTIIGERGVTLSGGERQRLSIARAFLKDAPVLVLDEPTSALDVNTEERLLKTLESLMRGRTTLIVAHRFSTLRNAELVVMLKNGCIVEMGLQTDLLARESLYACLFTARFSAHGDVLRGI
jgi:ABC-type multidrug transport system fused ATPase/permease subunit